MKTKLPKRLFSREDLKGKFADAWYTSFKEKERMVYDWESFIRKRLKTPQYEVNNGIDVVEMERCNERIKEAINVLKNEGCEVLKP